LPDIHKLTVRHSHELMLWHVLCTFEHTPKYHIPPGGSIHQWVYNLSQ